MVKTQILDDGAVFGNYRVIRRLGRGGAGEVYLVRHETLTTDYALKVLKPDVAEDNREFVERFIREGQIAAKIRHPNLVAVHDAGTDSATGLYYIVMDYVSGGSLRDLLRRMRRLAPARALDIIRQVAEALAEGAKVGLVHRDIKPENIMFLSDGRAVLADFGIAKARDAGFGGMTMAQTVFGTPAYMSPEQARDVSSVDPRSDLFSLGIVLFELIAGTRPYVTTLPTETLTLLSSPDPVPSLKPEQAPASVIALVSDLCEKDVVRRVPSAAELIRRIDACLEEIKAADPEEDQPTIVVRKDATLASRKIRISKRTALVAAIALVAAVAAVAVAVVLSSADRDDTGVAVESAAQPVPAVTPAAKPEKKSEAKKPEAEKRKIELKKKAELEKARSLYE